MKKHMILQIVIKNKKHEKKVLKLADQILRTNSENNMLDFIKEPFTMDDIFPRAYDA